MSQKSPTKIQALSQKEKEPKVKETKAKEPKVKDTKDKETKDAAKKEKTDKECYSLPLARIKTIMKSCPDASNIAPDALFMVCKSTEMFLQFFAKQAFQAGKKNLDYKHLSDAVDNEECLDFLSAICPKKITVLEYKKIMAKQDDTDSSDEESSEEEGSEEGEAEEESDEEKGGDVVEISDSDSDENNKSKIKHKTGDSP